MRAIALDKASSPQVAGLFFVRIETERPLSWFFSKGNETKLS